MPTCKAGDRYYNTMWRNIEEIISLPHVEQVRVDKRVLMAMISSDFTNPEREYAKSIDDS
jgi:hypothetical protein